MGDVAITETLVLDRSSMLLDLNGFSLICSEAASPAISLYNGTPMSDSNFLAVTPGAASGALQDVCIRNGFVYLAGDAFCQLDASRVYLNGLNVVGGEELFTSSTAASRSHSVMSDCIWSPSAVAAFTLPAGIRIDGLVVTDTHGAITLPTNASMSNCKLDGTVTLSGNGAQVTGCNLDDGVIDFTSSLFNIRNVSGCVLVGTGSGATAGVQDSYEGNS